MSEFERWGETLPATTAQPEPIEDGMVVHSYYDISMYAGTDEVQRFNEAETQADIVEAAQRMPLATVTFHQLPADEPFFDDLEPDVVLPY